MLMIYTDRSNLEELVFFLKVGYSSNGYDQELVDLISKGRFQNKKVGRALIKETDVLAKKISFKTNFMHAWAQ